MQAHLQPRALSIGPRTLRSRCRANTAGVLRRLEGRRRPAGAPAPASSHYRQAGLMTSSTSEGREFTFRAVFISDIHLGTPQAQATLLLPFLQKVLPLSINSTLVCARAGVWCRGTLHLRLPVITERAQNRFIHVPCGDADVLCIIADQDREIIPCR